MRVGDMIGCRSTGKIGRLIRYFKGGDADLSHVATIFTDTRANPKGRVSVLEAVGGGMRITPLTEAYERDHGEIFWMPMHLNDVQMPMVSTRGWQMLEKKKQYDYWSTLKAIFSPINIDIARYNCSESWWILMLFAKAVRDRKHKGRSIAPVPGDCALWAGKKLYKLNMKKDTATA
jgi:hypothetical protein